MKTYTKEFKKKIEKAKSILILTHKSPDADAFCSMIMMKKFLEITYPKKKIIMKTRQMPAINLPGMKEITIVDNLTNADEDLVIVTDAGSLSLCIDEAKDNFHMDLDQVVLLDHHTEVISDSGSFVINETRSSASEQVFATFKDLLGRRFHLTGDIAQLTQYGIVADTGRFLYVTTTPDTLRIYAESKEVKDIDIEDMSYKMSKFPKESTEPIITYLKTLTIKKDMAYMYITNEMIEENHLSKAGINEAQNFLRDRYIRFIQGVHWGFIIKPDFEHENLWYVSFRGTKGYQEVGDIAQELGGGGHAYASASPIQANTGEEALEKVLAAIKKVTGI